jgi:hypothetical protein
MAPDETRATMALMVKNVSDAVNAKARMKTMAEYANCVEWLIDDNWGRNYTLEDFRRICDEVSEIDNYGSLMRKQFVDVWRAYDRKKDAEALARTRRQAVEGEQSTKLRVAGIFKEPTEQKEIEPNRPDRVDWMRGESRMTWAERAELEQRDRQRREQNNQNNQQ